MTHQNPHEVRQLCLSLEAAKKHGKGGKKGFSCKKSTFGVEGSQIKVDSWKFNDWDYKRDDLTTYARGLFTTKLSNGNDEICIRGYDKFFNVNEVRETEWNNIERDTVGPYELSVKENGCIIFMSGLEDGTLLVCSKHSTGARHDAAESHAIVGEKWIERHLSSVGRTTRDLALYLRQLNATAVGELCDDDFEEHVLAYPPDLAGIYLHGINFNLPEFKTLSGPEVHQVADQWGFKKAEYQMIQTLDEMKGFLEKCAQTGSWNGRDTEGFVVRCKVRDTQGRSGRDWFFKYKFEEPYLMYRQWRECTKAMIAGRQPRYKKHKQVTEEYLLYARRRLAQDRNLAKEYNKNHGIIAMRDGFLAEKGKGGAQIIAEEEAEEGSAGNIILVPIATIGCGKTTVAKALVKLFNWGHFQNDNVQGKGNRPAKFVQGVLNEMAVHEGVVIADRNNHQKREREQLINDVTRIVSNVRFIALHWVHEPKDRLLTEIRRVTQHRIFDRGDNHQTIHADTKSQAEILGIMEGFLMRFQGCDTKHKPDCDFDDVIDLDVTASSLENLETVINKLYSEYPALFSGREMPTHSDMEDAIQFAMEHTVDAGEMHDLSFGDKKNSAGRRDRAADSSKQQTPEPQTLSLAELVKRLEYFSISLSATNINSMLSSLFSSASPDEAKFYRQLKGQNRIQHQFHVTLIHRASATSKPQLWESYVHAYGEALSKSNKLQDRTPSLGGARVRVERAVWDDRVMALMVRILPVNGVLWECANEVAHITVGTAGEGIKPKESNDLLVGWTSGEATNIHSKELTQVQELEGAVRPVFQRGR